MFKTYKVRILPPLRKDRIFLTYYPPFHTVKRGEFYLSGAIRGAYEAPNDLTQEFYIMERVKPPAKIL